MSKDSRFMVGSGSVGPRNSAKLGS